ncbi:acyl-CoA dehydrogenase family protein [Amycolatopsis marina]|nr:acyl-CoA dehydrogenase family protein [Amycolatopsis marina]
MTQAEHIAVPARRVWSVLRTPLSWPWLGDGTTRVEFLGRERRQSRYRMSRDGDTCEFSMFTHDRGAMLSLAEQPGPALSWEVAEQDGPCVLTWELEQPLPEPLAAHWRQLPSFADALQAWSRVVDSACGHSDPVRAVRALAPLIRRSARGSERASSLDPGVVAALRECGLFRIGVPRSLGGLDLPAVTIVEIIEQLSQADAAAGWCTLIGNQSAYAAWLPASSLQDLVGKDDGFVLAGSTAVSGTAEPTGNGTYRVNGRWRFNSGCLHADWLMGGVTVPDESGNPQPMLAFVPWTEATILNTWDVAGLAGTGSHDLLLTDVDVPVHRIAPLFSGSSNFTDPLHRLSPYNIQGVLMAGHPLGVARGALDELGTLASSGDAAVSAQELGVDLARLETELAAARSLVTSTVDGYWRELNAGDRLTTRSEARLALVLRHVVDTAKSIVGRAARLAGTAATEPANSVLQRCLRDIYGTGQHLAFSDDVYERNARRFIGEPARA